MNWLKKFMLFRLLYYNTKVDKIEKKIPDHDKYITNQEVNRLTKEKFSE